VKAVSQETRAKIDRLFRGGSFWSRLLASNEKQVELLHDIGFSGEAAAIPEVVCLLVDSNGSVWRAAAEAVHRLLQTLSPSDFTTLDQRVRAVGGYCRGLDENWRKLRPAQLKRFVSNEWGSTVLGIISCHNNGYVREAAVESLSRLSDGQELPFLLIRLNDWVEPVRDATANAIDARLKPEYARHFLVNLRLVLRLKTCGRANRALVESIFVLLQKPECLEVLQEGMKSRDRGVRRISFQLAASAEQSARATIIKAALTDTDSAARAWAVRRFLPELTAEELPSLAMPMLKDRFMPVRRDALWSLASKCPEISTDLLKQALLDRHVGMREVARHFLTSGGSFDARRFYLEALDSHDTTTLVAAIRGLGETGKTDDANVVNQFIQASEPRLRRAAAYAVGKLDAERFGPKLTKLLSDESPGVSREALKALMPKARRQPLEEFWHIFENDKRAHVRSNALTLVLSFGKWQKLPPLLLACADSDRHLSGIAQKALRDWLSNYNRSFAAPTRDDLQKIQDALNRTESKLPHSAAAEIRGCLKAHFP
jgi:HEAT repeat protein